MKLAGLILGLVFACVLVHGPCYADILNYHADLQPLNNSLAQGSVSIALDSETDIAKLVIRLENLEWGKTHHLYIQGLPGVEPTTIPTMALDSDMDGYLENNEIAPAAGTFLFDLTQGPDAALAVWLDFDMSGFPDIKHIGIREVVLYGMTVPAVGLGTPGEVNGIAGYKQDLPIAAGLLLPPIPEPATILLLSGGLCALAALRRRHKS